MTGRTHQIYFEDRVDEYRRIWETVATAIGADFEQLDREIWRISRARRSCLISTYLLQLDDPVVLRLCGQKPLVHGLLMQANLPVPDHVTFSLDTLSQAEDLLARHPNGIVIKPAAGYGGKGVTTHLTARREIRRAALTASMYSRQLLAEQQIAGECYRLLVFRGRVIGAVRRTGVRVTGDGATTIAELAASRADVSGISRLDDDLDIRFTLSAQGLSLASVPAAGAEVLCRSSQCSQEELERPELRTVYDADVAGAISENVLATATAAAEVVSSEFLGVDIIATDVTGKLEACGGVINEVNTSPALHHHYDSKREDYPACARDIIEALLSEQ